MKTYEIKFSFTDGRPFEYVEIRATDPVTAILDSEVTDFEIATITNVATKVTDAYDIIEFVF